MSCKTFLLVILMLLTARPVGSQSAGNTGDTSRPKLLVVGTAHLDTQWRWTIQKSIEEYIPATFRENYKLMERHPDYVFSFEGAFRYMLMHEYYPEDFERVRQYVKTGQWRVAGSWVDAVDVNIPSFESLVRHTLYGNGYFKSEFGKTSRDIFLPDCFGFGYALPSIAAHSGLESFSTQKLTWGSWVGIPFDIGIWRGVDGSTLTCAVNPGAYVSEIEGDLSRDTTWLSAAVRQGDSSGLYAAYRYFGTGDTGGAPDSASVDRLSKSIHSDGPLEVVSVGADDVVDLVASADRERLPEYDGELVMTRHGVGCYTSQAAMKRWNRKNELLADAAERAAVIAHRIVGQDYPREMLRDAWIRFLWHQFHDDLTGTSIPEAYEFSWNDEILCLNRFAAMFEHAVEATASVLDTRVEGTPIVVFNPLAIAREDVVEATVPKPGGAAAFVRVFGPDGNEVPSDVVAVFDDSLRILFVGTAPSVGYAVYDVRPSSAPCALATGLKVSPNSLENARYRVSINEAGEIASIYDKRDNRELLSEPLRYEILDDTPNNWPAWEIDYDDIMAPPLDLFVGSPVIRVVEDGCARVAVQIEQKTEHSVLMTTVSLAAGDGGNRVQSDADIDWYEREKLLKASISTTTANDDATYDLGLGVIKRGLNTEKRYEVPGHQWADLSDTAGAYGVAVFNDCRYGWDHPSPEKLRLTLVHTPGVASGWDWVGDQHSQDNGQHRLAFAVQGHAGDWRDGGVIWQAARMNQPLTAFRGMPHEGALGKTYSSLSVAGDRPKPPVMVNAVKLAENSDEIVIRVRELVGQAQNEIRLTFDRPVVSAREINGSEEETGPARVTDGQLVFSLTSYQPKAFAVTLEPSTNTRAARPVYATIKLPYNLDGISLDSDRCDGDLDGHGYSLVGELVDDTIRYLDIPFVTGPKTAGALNAVVCRGQEVALPQGEYDRLYVLAAAVDGPAEGSFSIDGQAQQVHVQDYADPVGRWNSRLASGELVESPSQIAPPYINRQPVAWYGSHRHTADCENDLYRFTYLFLLEFDMPTGARTLTLPANARIRLLAATVAAGQPGEMNPAQPLYDEARNTLVHISTDSSAFAGQATLSMSSPIPATSIHYTLDGTEPTSNSARYASPITVAATTNAKARAFRPGFNNAHVTSRTVTKLNLLDAAEVESIAGGLKCRYYEGEWERLPGFDTLEVAGAFVADTIAIPQTARDEDYGLAFDGFVQVPSDGVYAFSISSDDGSRLYVADTLLVDNDGLHGDYELTGRIGLKAGFHRLTAHMFQCKGGEALMVTVAGPSVRKQSIPAAMLFHTTDSGGE